MSRKSPYAAPTLEQAYADWCGMVLPLARGRAVANGERPPRKPSFKVWAKTHTQRYEEYQQALEEGESITAETPDIMQALREQLEAKGGVQAFADDEPDTEAGVDIAAITAAVMQALGKTAPASKSFRKRHTAAQRHEDGARNGLLWALNDEGLLSEALDASPGDYITQDAGLRVMETTFGPLTRT
jgi:hypothetical protein